MKFGKLETGNMCRPGVVQRGWAVAVAILMSCGMLGLCDVQVIVMLSVFARYARYHLWTQIHQSFGDVM